MTGLDDWSGAERILCVRLDAMGDVLMTTPALPRLKEALPGPAGHAADVAGRRRGRRAGPRGRRRDRLRGPLDEGHLAPGRQPGRSCHDRAAPCRPVRRGRDLHRLQPEPPAGGDALLPGRHPAAARSLPRESLPALDRLGARARARAAASATRSAASSTWCAASAARSPDERMSLEVPDRGACARAGPASKAGRRPARRLGRDPSRVPRPPRAAIRRSSSPRPRGGSSATTACRSCSPAVPPSATEVEEIRRDGRRIRLAGRRA